MNEIPYERLKEFCQAERRLKEGHQWPAFLPPTVEEISILAHLMLTVMYGGEHEDWELGKFIGWPEENEFEPTWEFDDGPYYDESEVEG